MCSLACSISANLPSCHSNSTARLFITGGWLHIHLDISQQINLAAGVNHLVKVRPFLERQNYAIVVFSELAAYISCTAATIISAAQILSRGTRQSAQGPEAQPMRCAQKDLRNGALRGQHGWPLRLGLSPLGSRPCSSPSPLPEGCPVLTAAPQFPPAICRPRTSPALVLHTRPVPNTVVHASLLPWEGTPPRPATP